MLQLASMSGLESASQFVFRAPGRANLMGEHTDYNDGFVLPVALDLATCILGRRRDGVVVLHSREQPGKIRVELATAAREVEEGWGRYVIAVVRALEDESIRIAGFEGMIASSIPVGAGLASSAALEVVIANALVVEAIDPLHLADICWRAENTYVGVESGRMDQLASAAGRAGHALLIDCRSTLMEYVPFPKEIAIVLVHSGVKRELQQTSYNRRRRECQKAAEILGVQSLRDADLHLLQSKERVMEEKLFRRARHVISENLRVIEVVNALQSNDLSRLGSLFAASHASLRDDYEVSTPELDALQELAMETEGVLAVRLTGAGFGGCIVNLVQADVAQCAAARIVSRFYELSGHRAQFWVSGAAGGAGATRVADVRNQ